MCKIARLSIHRHIQPDDQLRWVHTAFRILALGLGSLHAYAAIKTQSMNADGISYLDIGDAYFRADWANAINPVWSPLYSWILGLANFVFRPSMEWEFPTVHIVNLLIYIGALASFEFMWRQIRLPRSSEVEMGRLELPDWLWWTLGYLLFIWTSLSLIQIWSVTPDMLMSCFVFLAAGVLARIRAGDRHLSSFLSLGLILGLGYLSKTFMFSMALVFLMLSSIVVQRQGNHILSAIAAIGVFVLISAPFILLISEKKGAITVGEAGTVTYLRYGNGMPFPHWQGDPSTGIMPTHPSRIIHYSPFVYEFGEPVGGTYPISTDPSYWYEGIKPRFNFVALLKRLSASSMVYADLFFNKQGLLAASVLAFYAMRQKRRYPLREILRRWILMIPAIIAFGLYGMLLVAGRYVGVFVLLFWADILANIQLPDTPIHGSWLNALGAIAAFGLLLSIAMFNLEGFNRLNSSLEFSPLGQSAPPAKPLEVAQALRDAGVKPGDKVGVIGYAYDSFWARLARVKVVAEMLEGDADELWRGNEALQQSVLQSFAGAGATVVVAEAVPEYARLNGWRRVGKSNYFLYLFYEK